MHDAGRVGRLEAARDLEGHIQQEARWQRSTANPLTKRVAVKPLHHQVVPVVVRLADIVNGADVRMIERRRSPCFALKAGERRGIV